MIMEKKKVMEAYEKAKQKKIEEILSKMRKSEFYDSYKDIPSLYELVSYCWRLGFMEHIDSKSWLLEDLYEDIRKEVENE